MRHWSGTLIVDFRSGGRPEDYEGEYQCFSRNDYGTAISNKIFLHVSSEYTLTQIIDFIVHYSSLISYCIWFSLLGLCFVFKMVIKFLACNKLMYSLINTVLLLTNRRNRLFSIIYLFQHQYKTIATIFHCSNLEIFCSSVNV